MGPSYWIVLVQAVGLWAAGSGGRSPAGRGVDLRAGWIGDVDLSGDDRRVLVPWQDTESRRPDGVMVGVELGPVGMVELVEAETCVQRVVEAHTVDRLVHRLLDQQRGHRVRLGDALREFLGPLRQLVAWKDLAHHAEAVRFGSVDAVSGE